MGQAKTGHMTEAHKTRHQVHKDMEYIKQAQALCIFPAGNACARKRKQYTSQIFIASSVTQPPGGAQGWGIKSGTQ